MLGVRIWECPVVVVVSGEEGRMREELLNDGKMSFLGYSLAKVERSSDFGLL